MQPLNLGGFTACFKRPTESTLCWHCGAENANSKCSRCVKARYCNSECQTAAWAGHKKECKSFREEGKPVPLAAQTSSIFGEGKPLGPQRAELLRVIDLAKQATRIGPNDMQCSTCKRVSKLLFCSENPMPEPGREGGVNANATFVCGNGHMSMVTDVRFSLVQECSCNIEVPPVRMNLSEEQKRLCMQLVSTSTRLLLVHSFSLTYGTESSVYFTKLTPALTASGIAFDCIAADNGPALTRRLMSKQYSAVVFIHLEDRGFTQNINMFEGEHLGTLYQWVAFGGKLIIHGEGSYLSELLQALLQKPWHQCGDFYRRTRHTCNSKHFKHFAVVRKMIREGAAAAAGGEEEEADSDEDDREEEAKETAEQQEATGGGGGGGSVVLPLNISMKATMMSGVALEDRLFSPLPGARVVSSVPGFGGHVVNHERTGIALSPMGQGFVCYVGDVNAEKKTCDTIARLVLVPRAFDDLPSLE